MRIKYAGIMVFLCVAAFWVSGCGGSDDNNNDSDDNTMDIPSCRGYLNANDLAQCLIAGKASRCERIVSLFLYSRDEIAYELSYYQCKSVRQTLADGTGDCADKSLVLASMLESIGEKAYFVHITCNPDCSHRFVAVEISGDEGHELNQLTGGNGGYSFIDFKGKRLMPLDPAAMGYPAGYINDRYKRSTGENSWKWAYPTEVKRSTGNMWCSL